MAPSEAATEGPREDRQVQVRFTTKLPPKLRVTATPFAVPAGLTRYGLSEIINTLLALPEVRPFDFIIDGELLRTSLDKFLLARDLSAESIISIEYLPALVPPSPAATSAHQDWVSAVCGIGKSSLVSGSYDTRTYVFDAPGSKAGGSTTQSGSDLSLRCILIGHSAAITAVAGREARNDEGSVDLVLISASKDHDLRLWRVPPSSSSPSPTLAPTELSAEFVFSGHRDAVQSVAINAAGDLFCSGGWDSLVQLWRLTDEDDENENGVKNNLQGVDSHMDDGAASNGQVGNGEGGSEGIGRKGDGASESHGQKKTKVVESARKKRRGDGSVPIAAGPKEITPFASFAGHSQAVACVQWLPANEDGTLSSASQPSPSSSSASVFSSSWDHTIRQWDVETAANLQTITSNHPVLSFSARQASGGVVLAGGGSSAAVSVWDTRDKTTTAPMIQLESHKSWTSSVKWNPSNASQLLSASYDGKIKMWDIRGKIPLFTLDAHSDKVLDACFWGTDSIVSGGADCMLRTFKAKPF